MPRIRNVGGVIPLPFFVRASRFKRSNQWKRHGPKNVLKGTVRFGLSLVSSLLSSRRCYCSESKTILYLDTVYRKFLVCVSVEINPLKHRCFSTQTNLVYLGLVYVTMITWTRNESTVVLRGVTGV